MSCSEFYLVMVDLWLPEFEVSKKLYGQIEQVVYSQSNPDIHPEQQDYLAVMNVLFLGEANTSIATYVWLPLEFNGEYPMIRWKDIWS